MKLNICLLFSVNPSLLAYSKNMEAEYQNLLKKLLTFLYEHNKYKMTFSFSGSHLDWLEKNHPEYIQLLKELVSKRQIEITGGGYYNPIFPFLFPQDRTGQIELMTYEIRRTVGKRPRGMTILASIWDNSLVTCVQNCGIEYVFLDSSLIPQTENLSAKDYFLPLVLSEQGKSVKALPIYRDFDFQLQTEPEEYLRNLVKFVEEKTANDRFSVNTEERAISVNIEHTDFEKLFNSGWIKRFFECAQSDAFSQTVKITLPYDYVHKVECFVPAFVPSGMRSDVANWAEIPYTKTRHNEFFQITVNNFLITYKRLKAIYDRMLYISMIINHCHGDKARKKAARETLWKAQRGEIFVCSPEGVFPGGNERQKVYKSLTEAEKYIRESTEFSESVTSYDYDGDGQNEYVCRMEKYTACVTRISGALKELNVIQSLINYADNLSRIKKFDKIDDNFERGLFMDYLFTPEEFAQYKSDFVSENKVFGGLLFKEIGFNGIKNEIKLKALSSFSSIDLPVSLRKNYTANSNGCMVQYILKNEGPIPIRGNFVVESDFAQTDFSSADSLSYKIDFVSGEEKLAPDLRSIEKPFVFDEVSFLQITDAINNTAFVFEPNEDAQIICMPIRFFRPVVDSDIAQIVETSFSAALSWEVNLSAGAETERTINFTIKPKPAKKRH